MQEALDLLGLVFLPVLGKQLGEVEAWKHRRRPRLVVPPRVGAEESVGQEDVDLALGEVQGTVRAPKDEIEL